MSESSLLRELREALLAFAGPDDDHIEAWERRVVFEMSTPAEEPWQTLDIDAPTDTFLLMVSTIDGERVYDLLWRPPRHSKLENCPIVSVSEDGDTQVLAGNASDWLDALLASRGRLGGGSEDDIEDAQESASGAAEVLANNLADELDRSFVSNEELGARWDKAQERWGDAWAHAAEGLD